MKERHLWILAIVLILAGICTYIGIKSDRIHACRDLCRSRGFYQSQWSMTQHDQCICWNETAFPLE